MLCEALTLILWFLSNRECGAGTFVNFASLERDGKLPYNWWVLFQNKSLDGLPMLCVLSTWLYYLWAIEGFAWLSFHNFGDSRLQGDIYFTEHISIYTFNSGKKERKWGSLLGIHYITQRTDAVVQVAHNWAEEGLIIQEPRGTSVVEGRRGDSREAVGDRAASLFKTHISVPGGMIYPFCSKIKQKHTAQGSQVLHLQADKYQS